MSSKNFNKEDIEEYLNNFAIEYKKTNNEDYPLKIIIIKMIIYI